MKRALVVAACLFVAPLVLTGCRQGVGERCQVQDDCQDGLLCILPAGGTPQTGGTCQMPGSVGDGGILFDLGTTPPTDLSARADMPPAHGDM